MSRLFLKISLLGLIFTANMQAVAYAQGGVVVREASLSQLSLDEVGTLDSKNGGLGADIWRNTPHHYIEKLVVLLPDDIKSDALRDIKKRLLLTAAVPPQGNSEKKADLFALRLRQVARMGEYEAAADLLERVPAELRTEEMVQIIIAARLMASQVNSACKAIKANVVNYQSIEWRKWVALCQAHEGNKAAANLTLKLLAEKDFDVDVSFQELLDGLATKGDKKLEAEKTWAQRLSQVVLKLPEIEIYTPSQKFLDADLLFNAKATAWWGKQNIDNEGVRAAAAVRLYAMLEALGDEIKADDWLDLALFGVKHGENGVRYQIGEALLALAKQERKGDVLALAVMVGANSPVSEMPTPILTMLITSLKQMGYASEAKAIALEALQ